MVVVFSQSAAETGVTSSGIEIHQQPASHPVRSTGDSSTTDSPLYVDVVHPQSTICQPAVLRDVPDMCAINVVEKLQSNNAVSTKRRAANADNTKDMHPTKNAKVKVHQNSPVYFYRM